MEYNPFDFTPYHPPIQTEETEKPVEPGTLFYVNTTHRIGVFRTPITKSQLQQIEINGEEFFTDETYYREEFKNRNIKYVWMTSRCRETDDDIYTSISFHISEPEPPSIHFKIYNTFFDIPLLPVKKEPPHKQIVWSMMST